jgi:hypothetical protein
VEKRNDLKTWFKGRIAFHELARWFGGPAASWVSLLAVFAKTHDALAHFVALPFRSHLGPILSEHGRVAVGTLALALFALTGCSARSLDPAPEPPRCELNASAVCASAIENYLALETVRPAQDALSKSPRLVPLVAPVTLTGGELAAEVDCYVEVDPNGSWLVDTHVAISPKSPQAIEHLRNKDLCSDEWPERRLAMMPTPYNP